MQTTTANIFFLISSVPIPTSGKCTLTFLQETTLPLLDPVCLALTPSSQGWHMSQICIISDFYSLGPQPLFRNRHVTQARPLKSNSGNFVEVVGKERSLSDKKLLKGQNRSLDLLAILLQCEESLEKGVNLSIKGKQ